MAFMAESALCNDGVSSLSQPVRLSHPPWLCPPWHPSLSLPPHLNASSHSQAPERVESGASRQEGDAGQYTVLHSVDYPHPATPTSSRPSLLSDITVFNRCVALPPLYSWCCAFTQRPDMAGNDQLVVSLCFDASGWSLCHSLRMSARHLTNPRRRYIPAAVLPKLKAGHLAHLAELRDVTVLFVCCKGLCVSADHGGSRAEVRMLFCSG